MKLDGTVPSQGIAWLDKQGKPAWLILMVLGFILFWPLGLLILAYLIWSKRMFSNAFGRCTRSNRNSSGNSAFDRYKEETLRRLEQEEVEFRAFLQRLRDAKDKAEFEHFLDERSQKA